MSAHGYTTLHGIWIQLIYDKCLSDTKEHGSIRGLDVHSSIRLGQILLFRKNH